MAQAALREGLWKMAGNRIAYGMLPGAFLCWFRAQFCLSWDRGVEKLVGKDFGSIFEDGCLLEEVVCR